MATHRAVEKLDSENSLSDLALSVGQYENVSTLVENSVSNRTKSVTKDTGFSPTLKCTCDHEISEVFRQILLRFNEVNGMEQFSKFELSVRPCKVTDDDIYSGDSEDSGEFYEDEDDSNDENNWRNEYPEDEESHSEKSGDESYDAYDCTVNESLKEFHISDEDGDEDSYDGSKILKDYNDSE